MSPSLCTAFLRLRRRHRHFSVIQLLARGNVLCSGAGVAVLTVIATDVDNGNNGSVTYSLKQVPLRAGEPLFSVDPHMGLITTRLTNAVDREVQPIYHVIVQARDRGSPPMSGLLNRKQCFAEAVSC